MIRRIVRTRRHSGKNARHGKITRVRGRCKRRASVIRVRVRRRRLSASSEKGNERPRGARCRESASARLTLDLFVELDKQGILWFIDTPTSSILNLPLCYCRAVRKHVVYPITCIDITISRRKVDLLMSFCCWYCLTISVLPVLQTLFKIE